MSEECRGCGRGKIINPLYGQAETPEQVPSEPVLFDEVKLIPSIEALEATPIGRIIPVPGTDMQPAPMFEIFADTPPLRPAYSTCAGSMVRISAGQPAQDFYHAASAECTRPGCPMGMCKDHTFPWEFNGEKYLVCWMCYQSLRMYKDNGKGKAGKADPWIALVAEDHPELATWLQAGASP